MNLSAVVTISLASLVLAYPIPFQHRRALNPFALTEKLMPHSGIPQTVGKTGLGYGLKDDGY
ncbi:hypothetical protein P170DRAFT_469847 [Aspergillus steynii IBT 23096]|uniref:Uncharacterized protein n=1 Tax=Aspergillus steynii IBT 23096 TaxID=1392250 RepID=A0A2I2GND0_9EURO|nr:uncharacterized protein P170DRAFT_469847 [Aspergillus steynii IBT 23096]PLB54376.1 hypothetical protein P170DRAFT_469847 [Aspergillus steynii IBT 23096]